MVVVCGINISGDIFMYITVGLQGTQNILLLMYNSKNFNRSRKMFLFAVFFLFFTYFSWHRFEKAWLQMLEWSSWEVISCMESLDQTVFQEMNTWIISFSTPEKSVFQGYNKRRLLQTYVCKISCLVQLDFQPLLANAHFNSP